MLEALKQKLNEEAEKLTHELNVTLPAEIRRAVEMGDLRENSEYKAALERQRLVKARLGQIGERMAKLLQIDLSQISTDSVGLGSQVIVIDQETKIEETYHFVFGDALELEDNHVTMSSPIGRAMLGKKKGDEVLLRLPAITRKLKISKLVTIHQLKPENVK